MLLRFGILKALIYALKSVIHSSVKAVSIWIDLDPINYVAGLNFRYKYDRRGV